MGDIRRAVNGGGGGDPSRFVLLRCHPSMARDLAIGFRSSKFDLDGLRFFNSLRNAGLQLAILSRVLGACLRSSFFSGLELPCCGMAFTMASWRAVKRKEKRKELESGVGASLELLEQRFFQ